MAEADVQRASENGAIKSLRVAKVESNYYLFITTTWFKDEAYLATFRRPKEPRAFKTPTTLVDYIESRFPDISTVLFEFHKTQEEAISA